MLVDAQNLFSDAQAVTAAADSTNIIDLVDVRNIGVGENLYIVIIVDVALTDSGSDSAITVALQGDSTSTITPDATENILSIPAVSAIGAKFIHRLSPTSVALALRYINLKYTPTNGNLSTGSFTAFITHDIDRYISYPDNVTIS